MILPSVAPGVVADAVAALPGRLRSKLDRAVDERESWSVAATPDGVTVSIDGKVTVTLTAPVDAADRAVCDCLLAPRCLHRAAVLSAAPVLAPVAEPATGEPEAATPPDPANPGSASSPDPANDSANPGAASSPDPANDPAEPGAGAPPPARSGGAPVGGPVTAQEAAAAELARGATAQALERGIPGAGTVAQAELLRAIHQARAVGLPRLATAAVRVVEQLRAARGGAAGFRLAELSEDVREVLTVCHLLLAGHGDPSAARGTSRRGYRSMGDLRLSGLFTEPLRTTSGYVGLVTYLADDGGLVWTVSDVRPGDANTRIPTDAGVEFGEVRIGYRELGRAGILASDAVASADRRLSHGRAVRAVRSPGRAWHAEPVAALWRQPLGDQAGRWLAALDQPPQDRVAGHDLAFLVGTVAAPDRRGLLIDVADLPGPVVVVAPHDEPALPYVANLRQLAAHAAGHQVRLIGRFGGPRLVQGLAIAADWLPDRFGDHVDLGFDRLQRADLPDVAGLTGASVPEGPQPPLHLLRHHVRRVVAAGRAALVPDVDHDLRRLRDAQLPAAASVLRALREAGLRRGRDAFGRLDSQDASVLAAAWLAAAVYQHAATREAHRWSWQPSAADPTTAG